MICPFRIEVEFSYIQIEGTSDYLEKEQTQKYPECYEGECPYYIYGGGCERKERYDVLQ